MLRGSSCPNKATAFVSSCNFLPQGVFLDFQIALADRPRAEMSWQNRTVTTSQQLPYWDAMTMRLLPSQLLRLYSLPARGFIIQRQLVGQLFL